jgi:hypothetical protein
MRIGYENYCLVRPLPRVSRWLKVVAGISTPALIVKYLLFTCARWLSERKKGDVLTLEFSGLGVSCSGLNPGPAFRHSEAFRDNAWHVGAARPASF